MWEHQFLASDRSWYYVRLWSWSLSAFGDAVARSMKFDGMVINAPPVMELLTKVSTVEGLSKSYPKWISFYRLSDMFGTGKTTSFF